MDRNAVNSAAAAAAAESSSPFELSAAALEILDAVPDPILWMGPDLKPHWGNRAAEETFGWDRTDLEGLEPLSKVHPDDRAEALMSAGTLAERGVSDPGTLVEVRIIDAQGNWRRVEVRGQHLGDAGMLLSMRDLSQRHGWAVDGGDEHMLRAVLESASTPVLVCEPDGIVRSTSAAVVRSWGFALEDIIGYPLTNLLDGTFGEARADVLRLGRVGGAERQHRWAVDVVVTDSAGQRRPHRFEVTDLVDDPAVRGFVVFAHDTTDLHEALSAARTLSRTDPLTGLANRTQLLADLSTRLSVPRRRVAVLFCDLDGFKAVNDLHGHERGDELLCEVADRLRSAVRTGDLVARLGGDEFVVVCDVPADSDDEALHDLAERIELATVIDEGRAEGEHLPRVSASVGYVTAVAGTARAEDLIAEADAEMYRAKAARRGGEALPATVPVRRALASEFAHGCRNGDVRFVYQPVVAMNGFGVQGFETLVRWKHPVRGTLSPNVFMPVVEEAGLELRLADLSISAAVDLIAVAPSPMWVSVNLSPLQLTQPEVVEMLATAVAPASVDASRLVVEVTESSVIERRTRTGRPVAEVLEDIVALGIRLSVDDFGTGSSSLSRLGVFPADCLKVDSSFTARLGLAPLGAAVVRAVQTLGDELGVDVVVEGVETTEQLEELVRIGCRLVQGYLFAPGLSMADAVRVAHAGCLEPASEYAAPSAA